MAFGMRAFWADDWFIGVASHNREVHRCKDCCADLT
jgi:hypothetical protein